MQTPFGNTPNTTNYNTYGAAIGSGEGFVLDRVAGAKMAVSVRKLSQGYSGNYARIRRASDNLESDITTPYGGFISPQAAVSDGSGLQGWLSGADGAGVRWYDQSGAAAHLTQNTAANQFLLRFGFTGNRTAFAGKPLSDYQWVYPASTGNYLFGANKQFCFHFVVKTNVVGGSDFGMFYHIASVNDLVRGMILRVVGSGSGYKAGFVGGDLNATVNMSTVSVFDNTRPHHILFCYDGTVNTSWTDRLTVYVDGIASPMAASFQTGPFPAPLTQPVTIPRVWAPYTAITNSGLSEAILWDRLLTQTEISFLTQNTRKAYGL